MKNKHEIGQNYILNLENELLREKIKKLIADYKELKKMYDEQEAERMVQNKRNNAAIQEQSVNKGIQV
jgi:regulator of replication initiation timing